MEEASTETSSNDQLLLVLRELQTSLKGLEDHLIDRSVDHQGNSLAKGGEDPTRSNLKPEFLENENGISYSPFAMRRLPPNPRVIELTPPNTDWCHVDQSSIPDIGFNPGGIELRALPESAFSTIDLNSTPKQWDLLSRDDSPVDWKYCK